MLRRPPRVARRVRAVVAGRPDAVVAAVAQAAADAGLRAPEVVVPAAAAAVRAAEADAMGVAAEIGVDAAAPARIAARAASWWRT
jgi:hypothetical protein